MTRGIGLDRLLRFAVTVFFNCLGLYSMRWWQSRAEGSLASRCLADIHYPQESL